MVGMSGKASEPRRGHSSQQKKAAAGQGGGSNKVQPPPEALHVATILGDGVYPADLTEKMAQVMNMLPSCQEEDVCIALHDHDFDTARAISALLDRDLLSGTQGEWTTKKGRRSKGGDGNTDFIIAPGDTRLPGRQGGGGRGSNKAASQSVRENYGGSVTVGGEGGRGRGGRGAKGRGGSSGRGRSSSGRREDREGKREERQRERGERGGGRARNRGSRGAKTRAKQAATESDRVGEEPRVLLEEKILGSESWDGVDPQPSTEWDDHQGTTAVHSRPPGATGSPGQQLEPDRAWESEVECKESQTLFPEAFSEPTHTTSVPLGVPTASSAQPTAITDTTVPHQGTPGSLLRQGTPGSLPRQGTPGSLPRQGTLGSLPHQGTPGSLPHQGTLGSLPRQGTPGSLPHQGTLGSLPRQGTPGSLPHQGTPGSLPHQGTPGSLPQQPPPVSFSAPVEFQTTASSVSASHSSRLRSRHKRLARSQIPSQPVEMPNGSFPELSELGIAFGELELQTPLTTSTAISSTPPQDPQEPLLAAMPTSNEASYQSDPVTSATLTFSTQFPDDSGVISIATATTTSYVGSVKKLEAPPGLPHPLAIPSSTSLVTSGSLPHSVVPSGSLSHSVVPSGSLPHSVVPSGSLPHSVVSSGSLPHSVVPVVPSGSLPHSVVSGGSLTVSGSGSLPHTATLVHTVPLTTAQDTVVTTSGPQPPTTAVSQTGGVSALLPPTPLSLPPPPTSSLLSSMEPSSEHKTTSPTSSSSQLLSQVYPTSTSSATETTGGGASELLSSQTTPTCSSMATPTSKTLTAPSSHHHGNQHQLLTGQQGGATKHNSLQQQQQQQQQQQAIMYPYMLQPPLVMPMSAYYDHPEIGRYPASAVSMAYYHPTSSDPAMATGMGRDHTGSGFTAEGASGAVAGGKFGGRSVADITTSTTPSGSQQQGVQQGQMAGHAAVFNPYYGGNVLYPMYHGYGVPGFSHSIPKPSGGSSYPGGGVNSYQGPSGAGFGYEELGSGQEYKMYGGLGKPHPLTSTTGDLGSGAGYKHSGFDSGKTSYSTYSVPQGGYGFIPTGPMPLQMPPNYIPEGGGGVGGRGQKHSNKQYSGSHGSSQLWSQQPGHTH